MKGCVPATITAAASALAAATVLAQAPLPDQRPESPPGGERRGAEERGVAAPNAALDMAAMVDVQQRLRAAGFDPGNTNGLFDQKTSDAVRQFQRAKGLPVTGQIDSATRAALLGRPVPSDADRARNGSQTAPPPR